MNHPSFPTRAMGVCPHSQTTATECGLRRWLRLVGGACLCLIATSAVRADVFSNVPEAAGYNLAYELAIPVNGAFQGATAVPYAINNAATAAPAGFDRVAYYLELTNAAGTTTWVYASMDAFTTAVTQTGLPHATNNNVSFQRSVTHLEVASNVAGVKTGSFDRCQIEMWHHSYSAADPNTVFGSSNTLFDWGDTLTTASPSGYGSFQIHNTVGRQVVLAYNRWASNSTVDDDDVGIGSSSGAQPDWTFAANAATYTSRKLVVLVRPKRFTVTLTAVPVHQQVTPRNVATNAAIVPITGTETTGGFEKAVLKVLRNGVPYGADLERTLTYSGGSAAFSFSPSITAELANYTFELYLKQGANSYLVRRISGVTAGDVFMWYGQSNAQARNFSGSANAYASPWIRTFGMSSDNATVTQAHPFWVEANGDGSLEIPAGVGQWPLVVGRKIVDTYSIPVAILNGARGGYSMLRLQRDDANLNNLADTGTTTYRVYNRLRYRALQAKVNTGVRAIFFYQGESDVNNTAQHMSGFGSLMADWQVDYPAVEKVYVTQLHVGCSTSRELPALRDAQRLIPDIYDKGRIMSTNGLTAHTDNCHYPFTGGYETHGINAFRQVARDLYGAPDAPDIDPPNPARVEMANAAGDRLRIVLRKPGATITVDPAALVDFRLNGSPAVLLSSSVTATGIELQYDRPVTGATSLDYLAHIGNAPGWVRNGNGIGLLTFSEPVPATSHPVVTLVSPTGPVEFAAGTTVRRRPSGPRPTILLLGYLNMLLKVGEFGKRLAPTAREAALEGAGLGQAPGALPRHQQRWRDRRGLRGGLCRSHRITRRGRQRPESLAQAGKRHRPGQCGRGHRLAGQQREWQSLGPDQPDRHARLCTATVRGHARCRFRRRRLAHRRGRDEHRKLYQDRPGPVVGLCSNGKHPFVVRGIGHAPRPVHVDEPAAAPLARRDFRDLFRFDDRRSRAPADRHL